MSPTLLLELADHPEFVRRLTVKDYDQMIRSGQILEGDPFELLDGQVVRKIRSQAGGDPMSIGSEHGTVTTNLADLNPQLKLQGCFMRTQLPLSLPPYDEPEPDGLIIRGTSGDYARRHPGAADVLCVIEVADTSLRRDRGYKRELYANVGLTPYLIFNLVDRVVEVHTQPVAGQGRYGLTSIITLNENIAFTTATGELLMVPARQLFP